MGTTDANCWDTPTQEKKFLKQVDDDCVKNMRTIDHHSSFGSPLAQEKYWGKENL
jgi:hypothetical protein